MPLLEFVFAFRASLQRGLFLCREYNSSSWTPSPLAPRVFAWRPLVLSGNLLLSWPVSSLRYQMCQQPSDAESKCLLCLRRWRNYPIANTLPWIDTYLYFAKYKFYCSVCYLDCWTLVKLRVLKLRRGIQWWSCLSWEAHGTESSDLRLFSQWIPWASHVLCVWEKLPSFLYVCVTLHLKFL